MLKIYEVLASAAGIEDFVQQVRLAGSTCTFDQTTDTFTVFARKDYPDHDDNDPAVIEHIRNVEIGNAVDMLESLNEGQQIMPLNEKRPGNLAEFMATRKPDPITQEEKDAEEDKLARAVEQVDAEDRARGDVFGEIDDSVLPEGEEIYDNPGAVPVEFAGLEKVSRTINEARRGVFLKEVEKLLQIDMTSDVEILQTLAEAGETKRLLSVLLSRLDIEVSMTAVSQDLYTKTQSIKFRGDQIVSLEYYRRGASEMLRQIEHIRTEQAEFGDAQMRIKTLERELETQRSTSALEISRLREASEKAVARAVPQELFKAKYSITWMHEGARNFLQVAPNAAPAKTDPVEYALKQVRGTPIQAQAFRFNSLDDAKAQRKRILAHPQNCTFLQGVTHLPTFKIVRLGLDVVRED